MEGRRSSSLLSCSSSASTSTKLVCDVCVCLDPIFMPRSACHAVYQCFFASFSLCFSAINPSNRQKLVTPSTKLLPTHNHQIASAELSPCLLTFFAMMMVSVTCIASMIGNTIHLTCSTNPAKAGTMFRRLSYTKLPGLKFAPLGSKR